MLPVFSTFPKKRICIFIETLFHKYKRCDIILPMEIEESVEKQNNAVIRAVTVLEILSHHDSINLESLAKETSLPKATLLRFLTALVSQGYVYRDSYDQYSLTLKMFSVGSRALDHIDVYRIARPVAEKLANDLGETVHMGILSEAEAVYVLKIESKYTIRMHSRVGKLIPLYCTAIGKVLLSGLSDEDAEPLIQKQAFVPFTRHTIVTPESLKQELNEIRKNGWAADREEHEEGIMCFAAPLKDYTGNIVAALSASWPLFRLTDEKKQKGIALIKEAANQISSLLGYEEK